MLAVVRLGGNPVFLRNMAERHLDNGFGSDIIHQHHGVEGFLPVKDAVRKAPEDEEKLTADVLAALAQATDAFVAMRETEGEKLREDILSRAETILCIVGEIEERSPQTVKEYEERLLERIRQTLDAFSAEIDEQRVLTEVAVFADKVAVAEETVRLRSHFEQLRSFLNRDEPVGRKIDFIIQEMNREANTIGSKVQDAVLAHKVVDIKSEIEKIREQVQNIE